MELNWDNAVAMFTIGAGACTCLLIAGKSFFETRKGSEAKVKEAKDQFCRKVEQVRNDIKILSDALERMDRKRDRSRKETSIAMTEIAAHMASVNQYMHDHEIEHTHLRSVSK